MCFPDLKGILWVVKRDRNIQKRTREYQKFSPSLIRKNSNTNTNSIKVGLSQKKGGGDCTMIKFDNQQGRPGRTLSSCGRFYLFFRSPSLTEIIEIPN